MDRRAFLAAAGAGLAGCGSTGETDATATGSPTRTATATPTVTATPTRTPPERRYQPQLLAVALVSTWSEPGDLTANRIDRLQRGQPAVVAFRYRIRIPEGTINLKEGVDVIHDDDLVVRRFRDVDRRVDAAGLYTWEDAMAFETDAWPTGDLTASVAVGELQLHRTSDSLTTTFELVSA
ncbi:hypothetical protein [Haloplanus halophilus]|uniref:hypothetical protein n=1 Tax=Haloplanus halophilus TaxID=2949993 RepID=UPI00203CC9B0|nr:hypothetical protein [Haloplanus sp. GDY1]